MSLPANLPSRAATKSVAATATTPGFRLSFGAPETTSGRRIVLYGEGGVGKTTLCAALPGTTAFFDLDKSLLKLTDLRAAIDGKKIAAVKGVTKWEDLRAALESPGWGGFNNIVIDTMSVAEGLAVDYVLRTVKRERGARLQCKQMFGFGLAYKW